MVGSILITGCSSGIGYASAKVLHERGWKVFAACRKSCDCDKLKELGIDSPLLDYDIEDTIISAVEYVLGKTNGKLDVLFNNGAFAQLGAVEDLPVEALKASFQSNFFGWHTLTCKVIPIMRKQGHGRILQCSSVLGFSTLKFRGAYQATKYALEGLTDTLRLELLDTGIHVILLEPGSIKTRIRYNASKHFYKWINIDKSPWNCEYEDILIPKLEQMDESIPLKEQSFFKGNCDIVIPKILHAIESKKPAVRYFITKETWIAAFLKRICTSSQFDVICKKVGF